MKLRLAFVLIKYSYKHGKKKAEKKQDDTEKEDQKFLRTQYFLFACCVSFLVDLFLEGLGCYHYFFFGFPFKFIAISFYMFEPELSI